MRAIHIRSRKIQYILAFTMALIASAFWFSESSAHAYLVRSEPSDGLVLSEGPTDMKLWFDEPVSGKFSSAQLIDANGQPVKIDSIHVEPTEPKLLIITLPELEPGAYSLLYKALSETDGHYSQGLLVFGVGEETDMAAAKAVESESQELPLPEVGLRWFSFAILAGVVGAVAIAQLVFGPSRIAANRNSTVRTVLYSARRRVVGLALGFSVLGLVVGLGLLLWQTHQLMASLPDGANALDVSQQVLTDTRWGLTWLLRQLNFLLLLPLLFGLYTKFLPLEAASKGSASRREGVLWSLVTMLAFTLIAAQSLTSHASGLEDNTTLALLADALHLLAASLWVGGLLAMAMALVPLLPRQRTELPTIIKAGWKPFSIIAVLCVVILFATGFYNTGRQVASADALLTTFYGQALMAKVFVVLLVGAIGLLNSMLLHPRLATPLARILRRSSGWTPLPLRKLPTLVIIEVSIGVLVLLIAGVMTSSATPRGIEYAVDPEEIPNALSQTVDDLVITLNAKPNRPGQNVFSVFARSTRKPEPAEIGRVLLRFEYLGRDVGRTSATAEQVASDRFILTGNHLNLGGEWRIQVVVRRLGLEDSVATFNWIVAPAVDVRPTVVSRAALEPALTLLAAAILLLVATAVTIGLAVNRKSTAISRSVKRPHKKIAAPETTPTLSDTDSYEPTGLAGVVPYQEATGD